MKLVKVRTLGFSFFGESDPVSVAPCKFLDAPVLSAARYTSEDEIELHSDVSLDGYRPSGFALINADGVVLPEGLIREAAISDGGKLVKLKLALRPSPKEQLSVRTTLHSNYDPTVKKQQDKTKLYFGAEANGIRLRKASEAIPVR